MRQTGTTRRFPRQRTEEQAVRSSDPGKDTADALLSEFIILDLFEMRYVCARYASATGLTPHFIRPHLEALEHIRTEGVTERYIRRIPSLGD
jgi:hypothetical protein